MRRSVLSLWVWGSQSVHVNASLQLYGLSQPGQWPHSCRMSLKRASITWQTNPKSSNTLSTGIRKNRVALAVFL